MPGKETETETEDQIIAKERRSLMALMDGELFVPSADGSKSESYGIPSRRVDDNLLIATWNIQNLNNNKSNRALRYMADICERFDLIAIQEIKTDLRGLARLQDMLPGNYRILVTDPTGNNERMAFLYDRRTIESTGLACEIGFHGSIAQPSAEQFNRMPFCASFRAGRFDFVIATVHIVFGDGAGGKARREAEIRRIAEFVQKRAETEAEKVFDRDFFIVGDFNIEKSTDQFFRALTAGTNFKMPPGMDELATNFDRDSTFDKIAWFKREDREDFKFNGNSNVVPFREVLFQEHGRDPKGGKREMSDHLPLWAEFGINELTQELNQIINRKP